MSYLALAMSCLLLLTALNGCGSFRYQSEGVQIETERDKDTAARIDEPEIDK